MTPEQIGGAFFQGSTCNITFRLDDESIEGGAVPCLEVVNYGFTTGFTVFLVFETVT